MSTSLPPATPEAPPAQSHPVTLTDRVRMVSGALLFRLGMTLYRAGLHPDTLTIIGTLLVLLASGLLAVGQFTAAGVVLLAGLPFDALDGAVARAMQRTDSFGALLDSSLDRYADAFIFAGLGYYFASQNRLEYLLLAFAALIGSFMVSYVRARAEGLHISVKIGWFSRLERVALILLMVLVPPLLPAGLVVLAVGTNLTGLQRLWFVYRALKKGD